MRFGIRAVDVALVVWSVAWLVAGAITYASLENLEDGGEAVVAAGAGLQETSAGLKRTARGLHETADDLDRFAVRVRETGRDAEVTGAQAQESAGTLAVVLGLAVALTPTVPIIALYLLLRPLVAQQLRRS